MNTQDILQKGRQGLGFQIDDSETYDFEVVMEFQFECEIDSSETFDFELVKNLPTKILEEYFTEIKTYRLLTEEGGVLKTEDNFRIRY